MKRKIAGKEIEFSNLDKVMYPATGFAKRQVIDHYISVSRYILPHIKNRPVTLKRYPNGVTGEHFYEKNAPLSLPAGSRPFRCLAPAKHQ
jgi:bifunctional non-homologous end joining protein LigD